MIPILFPGLNTPWIPIILTGAICLIIGFLAGISFGLMQSLRFTKDLVDISKASHNALMTTAYYLDRMDKYMSQLATDWAEVDKAVPPKDTNTPTAVPKKPVPPKNVTVKETDRK